MATIMAASQMFHSPKRKRGSADSAPQSPQQSNVLPRLSTDVETIHSEPVETGSPRSLVAGHLQHLDITGPWVRQLSFKDAGRARKRFAQMSPEPESHFPHQAESQPSLADQSAMINPPLILPCAEQSSDGVMNSSVDILSSPRISDKPRARSKSPPFDGDPDENPLTWHESEITGHNPTDPNDDGYGMNGIGFRPTASIAWSRSQRRKQQIAEYRNREAKEARQRRSERRQHGSVEVVDDVKVEVKAKSKVRFDDSMMDDT